MLRNGCGDCRVAGEGERWKGEVAVDGYAWGRVKRGRLVVAGVLDSEAGMRCSSGAGVPDPRQPTGRLPRWP